MEDKDALWRPRIGKSRKKKKKKKQHLVHRMVCLVHKLNFAGLKGPPSISGKSPKPPNTCSNPFSI